MAIDFPPNAVNPNPPSNGDTYVDAASGTEWEYNATNNSWTIVSSSGLGGGAFVYIGEHDFTQAAVPSPVAEAGFVYSQSDIGNAPGNVNGVYTGIAGDTIVEGTLVLYTGSSWTFMSTTPGYPNLGDGNGDTLDTRYVRTQGDDSNVQTITGDAGLKTEGLLESDDGVSVTGGRSNNDAVLAYDERYDRVLLKSSSTYRGFAIEPDGTCGVGRLSAASLGAATLNINKDTDSSRAISVTGAINLGDKSESYIGINNQLVPSEGATDIAKYMYGFSTSFDSSQWTNDASAIAEDVISFNAGANHFAPCTGQKIAFRANNANAANAFNFYAEGSAPNYFKGAVRIGGLSGAGFNPGYGNEDVGFVAATFADLSKGGILYISREDGLCSSFNTNTVGILMDFRSSGTQAGYISTTADGGILISSNSATGPVIVQNSDARVKTLTSFSGNAADTIQLLNPGVNGFIAHELQAHVSEAVTGTQDATEEIGTLYDFDGTILETGIPEPPVEEQSYVTEEGETRVKSWIETGTRDVYQGVDQTKLIPLLTKALQEALERIEALENA